MKKYIMPNTDIEIVALGANILETSNTPQAHNSVSEGDQLGNLGLFDGLEDAYPTKGNDLWDDAYQNDGI